MNFLKDQEKLSQPRFWALHIYELCLLILVGLSGCLHASQPAPDRVLTSHGKIRPIDIETATAEEIGKESLAKIGYDEIINMAQRAGFVEYKLNFGIQLISQESTVATGFAPVFSRYAVAAAVASQADSPLPGPADLAAVGIIVVGLVDAGLLDGYLFDSLGGWLFSRAKDDAAKVVEREEKEAERALKNNQDFRRWFHREYKADQVTPQGTRKNPDLTPEQVRDAYQEWLQSSMPKVK